MAIVGILFGLFAVLAGLLLCVFWIWMLIDAIKNDSLDGTERVVWVLVILFLHALGALIYYLVGRKK